MSPRARKSDADLIWVDPETVVGEHPELGEVIREPHSAVVTRVVDKKRKAD